MTYSQRMRFTLNAKGLSPLASIDLTIEMLKTLGFSPKDFSSRNWPTTLQNL